MCLTEKETRTATVRFYVTIIPLLSLILGVVWGASDANRRLITLEQEAINNDRFTQAEGDIQAFQIKIVLEMASKMRITLEQIRRSIDEERVFSKTHRHDGNGLASP